MPIWHGALYGLNLVRNSYLMVNLFFVLSGFVINLNYGARIRSAAELVRFQLLRFGRLYPVHFVFLMIYLLLEVLKWQAARKYNVPLPNGRPFEVNSGTGFVEQLFLVQALGTDNAHSFNGPSWSISVEFYTYLAFALVCLAVAAANFRNAVFALLGIGCTVVLIVFGDAVGNFSFILQGGAGFFIGCATAAISARITRTMSPLWATALVVGLLLFLCLKTGERYDWLAAVISAAMIIAIVHAREGLFRRALRARPLEYLGLISYSVYMSHGFVLWSCNQFVRVILKRPERVVAGFNVPQLSLAQACIGDVMVIII